MFCIYSIILFFILTCVLPGAGSREAQETLLSQGVLPGRNQLFKKTWSRGIPGPTPGVRKGAGECLGRFLGVSEQ